MTSIALLLQTCTTHSCKHAFLLFPENQWVNTLRPRQNGRHFPDDIFKLIFLNENVWISINISLKVVPRGPINNILTLVQVMAWRRPGDKPLSEPMMVRLPTHICFARPQWVNGWKCNRWTQRWVRQVHTKSIDILFPFLGGLTRWPLNDAAVIFNH